MKGRGSHCGLLTKGLLLFPEGQQLLCFCRCVWGDGSLLWKRQRLNDNNDNDDDENDNERTTTPPLLRFRDGYARSLRTQWERICVCVWLCAYIRVYAWPSGCHCATDFASYCSVYVFIYLFILFMRSFIYHFILWLCPSALTWLAHLSHLEPLVLITDGKLRLRMAILPSGREALCSCVVVNGPWPRLAIWNVTTPGIHVFTCTHMITIVVISSRQWSGVLLILSPSTWDCSHSPRLTLYQRNTKA